MFNSNPKQSLTRVENAVTILTQGTSFDGKLCCRGSSRIGGDVGGAIVSDGVLIIEKTARVKAEVSGENIIVQGNLIGRIVSSDRVELQPGCNVQGDIESPRLIVHDGATFNGSSAKIDKPESKSKKQIPSSVDRATVSQVNKPN